jgi:hypothetical protein
MVRSLVADRTSLRVLPPDEEVAGEERGDYSALSSMSWKAVATLEGSTEKRLIVREGSERVTHWCSKNLRSQKAFSTFIIRHARI